MPKKKYGEMTIGQLKDELRSKHAKLSGRKADLVERYVMGRVIIGYIGILMFPVYRHTDENKDYLSIFADRRRICRMCLWNRCRTQLGGLVESSFGCTTCNVYLCREVECFRAYHAW